MWQASGAQFGLHNRTRSPAAGHSCWVANAFVLTSGDADAERPLGGVGGGVACTDGARDAVVEELVSPGGNGPDSRSVGAALVRAAAAAAGDTGGGCRMIVAPSEAAAKPARR